jgi:dTDP-4-amino-4,6-dideoxygalactose transaminase
MDAKHFPSSVIKAQPAFKLRTGGLRRNNILTNDISTFSKARYALAAAALHLKHTNQQNTVLLPAYHCPALVEPFIYAGYNIVFYPQLADLSSDLAVFNRLLTPDVTHVVVVRYFGFSQNAELLMLAAHNAGIKVIEDNAHSLIHFLRTCTTKPIEVNASVSSISKTLGTADGGVLYLRDKKLHCQQPDMVTELKALITGIRPVKHTNSAAFRYFQPAMLEQDSLRLSKWLMMHSDFKAISEKRRQNYQYLADNLKRSSAGKVLYPTLEQHDVPYVMPFLLNNVNGFSQLREQAIQVLRWEELALPISHQAGELRENLAQLPIHQNISFEKLDMIIVVLK